MSVAARRETDAHAYRDYDSPASVTSLTDSAAFDQRRVPVQGFRSDWCRSLEERLNELTALSRGWDGYFGRPVSFSTASFAANILEKICDEKVPSPSLVPGSDGSLQIEWHCKGYDIEIDVISPGQVVAYRRDCETGHEEERELRLNFALLVSWIDSMVENE